MAIIKDTKKILKVYEKGLAKITSPRTLFTQDDEINPSEVMGGEATQTKNPLDNGEMSPLLTQPPSQYSPPVDDPDAPEAPESPPPVPPEYTSNANLLESEGDPERDCPTAANDKLFGVYQDWMHQNPGTHLDCRIDEDGKWQKIWKT